MFVLDASVTMAWCFQDERTAYTEAILRKFATESCIVPLLWISEIANILQVGVKRKRITESEVFDFCTLLASLPIATLDQEIIRAAKQLAIPLFLEPL